MHRDESHGANPPAAASSSGGARRRDRFRRRGRPDVLRLRGLAGAFTIAVLPIWAKATRRGAGAPAGRRPQARHDALPGEGRQGRSRCRTSLSRSSAPRGSRARSLSGRTSTCTEPAPRERPYGGALTEGDLGDRAPCRGSRQGLALTLTRCARRSPFGSTAHPDQLLALWPTSSATPVSRRRSLRLPPRRKKQLAIERVRDLHGSVGGFALQPNAVEAHTGFEPVLLP